jgi:hypothetical protein
MLNVPNHIPTPIRCLAHGPVWILPISLAHALGKVADELPVSCIHAAVGNDFLRDLAARERLS